MSAIGIRNNTDPQFLLINDRHDANLLRKVKIISFNSRRCCFLTKEPFNTLFTSHKKRFGYLPYIIAVVYDRLKKDSEIVCDGWIAYKRLSITYKHPTTAVANFGVKFFQYSKDQDTKKQFVLIFECATKKEFDESRNIIDFYDPERETSPIPFIRDLCAVNNTDALLPWIDVYTNIAVAKENIDELLEISEKLLYSVKVSQSVVKAKKILEKCLEFDPKNTRALHELAILFTIEGTKGSAEVFFEKAFSSIEKDFFPIFEMFASILDNGGREAVIKKVKEQLVDSSISADKKNVLKKAFTLWPFYSSLLFAFALFAKDKGDSVKAEGLFQQAIRVNPVDFYSHVHLAEILYARATEDPQALLQAVDHLKKGLFYGGLLGDSTRVLAKAYFILGKIGFSRETSLEKGFIKALEYFREALEIDPTIADAILSVLSKESLVVSVLSLLEVKENMKKLLQQCSWHPAAVQLLQQLAWCS